MHSLTWVALLGLLAVCRAAGAEEDAEVVDTVEVVFERQVAGQAEWASLDVVSVPRFPDGTGRVRTVAGKVDQEVDSGLVKSLVSAGPSGLFRVRAYVAEQGPAGAALTSVPACGLVQSGLKLQLSVGLSGQGDHVDIVEAQLPKSFTGCDAAVAAAAGDKLSGGGRLLVRVMSLWSTVTQELPLFAANGGSPYPGSKASTGGNTAADTSPEASLVDNSDGEDTKKKEAPKSFFQQYWHFIVPAMVLYMMMGAGGEKPGAAGGGNAAAAGGGGGGGSGGGGR